MFRITDVLRGPARCGPAVPQNGAAQSSDLQTEDPAPRASTPNMDVLYEKHTGVASAII